MQSLRASSKILALTHRHCKHAAWAQLHAVLAFARCKEPAVNCAGCLDGQLLEEYRLGQCGEAALRLGKQPVVQNISKVRDSFHWQWFFMPVD